MVKPISPHECKKEDFFPPEVLEAFNECIQKHFNGRTSHFKREEVMQLIITKFNRVEIDRAHVYKEKWLDVEDVYRRMGWNVVYEQPSYGDSDFEPYYEFKVKK